MCIRDSRGVIDIVAMKALVWDEGMGEEFDTLDIPADLADAAEAARHDLVDVLSRFDEVILEKYVDEEEITPEDLARALRAGTVAGEVAVSYTHLRAHETVLDLVCRLLL